MRSLVTSGKMLLTGVQCPFIKLLLWLARGSHYWKDKWIAAERNLTNRRVLLQYLKRDEVESLQALQGFLLVNDRVKTRSSWEVYRLFAVMEAANNGSCFAQSLLEGVITPFQAGKLGLTCYMDALVVFIDNNSCWREEWTRWLRFDQITEEAQSTEYCFKVNKLT